MAKKLLITGAAGPIGSAVVLELLPSNHKMLDLVRLGPRLVPKSAAKAVPKSG